MVPRSGRTRFQVFLFAHHDLTGVAEVMDPLALETHRRKPALAMDAHSALLLVVLRRVELRSVGYQPTALAVELQDHDWYAIYESNAVDAGV